MNQLKLWLMMMSVYLGLISWSLNTWISIWMVMEISVLFLMGMLSLSNNYDGTSLMMKYYLIQLVISVSFLAVSLFYVFNFFIKSDLGCVIMLLAKLGVFPFHYWVIMAVGKMDWLGFFFMSTIFKLPPLSLIYFMIETCNLGVLVMGSAAIGSFLGLNNVVIQKLLSYSSLVQLCWLLVSLSLSISLYVVYFLSYSFVLAFLISMLKDIDIFYMSQFKFSPINKFYIFMILFVSFSFVGFPPFIGFLMKWLLGSFMFYSNMKFMIFLLIFISVLSAIFYLQLFYFFLLVFSIHYKWYFGLVFRESMFLYTLFIWSFYSFIYFCL